MPNIPLSHTQVPGSEFYSTDWKPNNRFGLGLGAIERIKIHT